MEKQTWGGARPGAGRKKGSVKDGATGRKKIFQTASISGTPEEIARLKANAESAGQSVSRFVISQLAGIDGNTGTFRGLFDSVNELNAYSGEVTNNDYAIVQTNDKKKMICQRYRWNGTAWTYVGQYLIKIEGRKK